MSGRGPAFLVAPIGALMVALATMHAAAQTRPGPLPGMRTTIDGDADPASPAAPHQEADQEHKPDAGRTIALVRRAAGAAAPARPASSPPMRGARPRRARSPGRRAPTLRWPHRRSSCRRKRSDRDRNRTRNRASRLPSDKAKRATRRNRRRRAGGQAAARAGAGEAACARIRRSPQVSHAAAPGGA